MAAKIHTTNCPYCGADHSEWMLQSGQTRDLPAAYVCECDARLFVRFDRNIVGGQIIVDSVSAADYRSAQADYESQLMSCDGGW